MFENNISDTLSIDDVAVTNGERYTVVTNKAAKGGTGAFTARVAGTTALDVMAVLARIPEQSRQAVKEVTLEMANAMNAIIRASVPHAAIVTDRFPVQQLVSAAVQEIRIKHRREALKEETTALLEARKEKRIYQPTLYENGDTKKQLLARSHYVLFKPTSTWTVRQHARAAILFREFSALQHAYNLSMMFRAWYENKATQEDAREK